MDLFAYGTLRARKAELSFVPGVVLTLNVKNPTDKEVDVSFLFNIPLGEQPGMVIGLQLCRKQCQLCVSEHVGMFT